MGNIQGKEKLTFEDWEKLQTVNGVDIFINKQTNELAQKRIVSIDPQFDLNNQLQIYHLREFNNDSLVRSFGARQIKNKNSSNGICSGHKKLQVFTEKISYHLCDLPQLTFSQSLLFLRQCLRAYSKVFRSYGPTHITKRMIGINEYGEVRCWLNQNWALNHPDHEFPTLQSTKIQGVSERDSSEQYLRRSEVYDGKYRDQTEMVHNIVCLIKQKCEEGNFPIAFSEEIEKYSTSFRKLTLYLQDFLTINQMFVPPKISYDTVFVTKIRMKQENQLRGELIQGKKLQSKELAIRSGGQIDFSGNTNYNRIGQPYSTQGESYLNQLGLTQLNQNITDSQRLNYLQSYQPRLYDNNIIMTKSITTNTIEDKEYQQRQKRNETYLSQFSPQPNFSLPLAVNTVSNYNQSVPSNLYKPIHNSSESSNSWLRPLSISKQPAQSQSSYSSSYYQYSFTNPSIMGNYNNQGNFSTKTDLFSIKDQVNPQSYTTSFDNKLQSESKSSNLTIGNVISYKPIAINDTISSTFKNYDTDNQKNMYAYSFYQHYSKFEPNYSQNAQNKFAFSSDERQNINPKFMNTESKPFSNFSTNYEPLPFPHAIPFNTKNQIEVQAKYLNQFDSIIGNTLLKETFNPSQTAQNPIKQPTMTNTSQQLSYRLTKIIQPQVNNQTNPITV